MNCQEATLLIDSYADGELDAAGILELEKHLHDCPACALTFRNVQNLKKSLKQDSLFFTAPAELRQKLKAELRSQTESNRPFWTWNWFTAATTGVAVICLALLLPLALTRPSPQQQLAQEIVSSHIRSLMANHEMDVASSDQHTVKPWFDGKLDFSPPVKDLAAQGFPLIGGRLDYLDQRAVAALVFHRAKHVINVFIWPTTERDSKPAARASINGYHLIHWSQGGMTFWAVSDLNEKELMEFVQDFGTN
ncbi:MAG TPA: anti-sigma factor [Candidatus Sulfopaludibacter sp.]|nr:anti-sigma factor [Candidatus Sulfopaludibacter sp.]